MPFIFYYHGLVPWQKGLLHMMSLNRRLFLSMVGSSALVAPGPVQAMVRSCTADPLSGLDKVADQLLRTMPEVAVYAGDMLGMGGKAAQRQFSDYSPQGEAHRRAVLAETQRKTRALLCVGDQSPHARQVMIADKFLSDAHAQAQQFAFGVAMPFWFSGQAPYVVNQVSGPHIDGPTQMIAQQFVRDETEAEAYVAKINDMPRAFTGLVQKIYKDAEIGCIAPAILLQRAIGGLDRFGAYAPENHPLVLNLDEKLKATSMDATKRAQWVDRARLAVRSSLQPAYAQLRSALVVMAAKDHRVDGVWDVPDGPQYYASQTAILGDTSLSPAQIHQLGLSEVARITHEIDLRLKKLGYTTGSIGARLSALSQDPKAQYENSPAGRQQLLRDVEARIAHIQQLQSEFLNESTIPAQKLVVSPVPADQEESAPGGSYDPPSLDGTRPGTYWINLRDLKENNRISIPTLTYHEAVPGHHLQGAVAFTQKATARLNKYAPFNAFVEGWALYAERLAFEMGLYEQDPYGDIGRLQDELLRAVRLVMDTGLHHYRWSREQAMAYMRDTMGAPESVVVAETERYMAWPGQALGYKLGQLRLLDLRQQALDSLGDRFRLADFHDAVLLDGNRPMDMVEQSVARWVDMRRA